MVDERATTPIQIPEIPIPRPLGGTVNVSADDYRAFELEQYKARTMVALETEKSRQAVLRDFAAESWRATDRAGNAALAAVLVINGGAAVAVLNVLAGLQRGGAKLATAVNLGQGLGFFAAGVLLAGIATGFKYISQGYFTNLRPDLERAGKRWQIAAIALWGLGLFAFSLGAWRCYAALVGTS